MGKFTGENVAFLVGEPVRFRLGVRLGVTVTQRSIGRQMLLVPDEPGTFSSLSHPFLFVHSQIISL